ncbi:MAG TPA: flagellar protein FlaG [Steroidobacteraceae bacterium]|nr:flagellar protein FlaG [Steroidobacteraceae bacterium]
MVVPAGSGKDLPPPPSAHLDVAVVQSQQQRQAALAQQMSDYLRSNSRDLVFQVDPQSGHPVITVLDAAGNVVRRIPGEAAMQMLRRANVESGTFIDSVA